MCQDENFHCKPDPKCNEPKDDCCSKDKWECVISDDSDDALPTNSPSDLPPGWEAPPEVKPEVYKFKDLTPEQQRKILEQEHKDAVKVQHVLSKDAKKLLDAMVDQNRLNEKWKKVVEDPHTYKRIFERTCPNCGWYGDEVDHSQPKCCAPLSENPFVPEPELPMEYCSETVGDYSPDECDGDSCFPEPTVETPTYATSILLVRLPRYSLTHTAWAERSNKFIESLRSKISPTMEIVGVPTDGETVLEVIPLCVSDPYFETPAYATSILIIRYPAYKLKQPDWKRWSSQLVDSLRPKISPTTEIVCVRTEGETVIEVIPLV